MKVLEVETDGRGWFWEPMNWGPRAALQRAVGAGAKTWAEGSLGKSSAPRRETGDVGFISETTENVRLGRVTVTSAFQKDRSSRVIWKWMMNLKGEN